MVSRCSAFKSLAEQVLDLVQWAVLPKTAIQQLLSFLAQSHISHLLNTPFGNIYKHRIISPNLGLAEEHLPRCRADDDDLLVVTRVIFAENLPNDLYLDPH